MQTCRKSFLRFCNYYTALHTLYAGTLHSLLFSSLSSLLLVERILLQQRARQALSVSRAFITNSNVNSKCCAAKALNDGGGSSSSDASSAEKWRTAAKRVCVRARQLYELPLAAVAAALRPLFMRTAQSLSVCVCAAEAELGCLCARVCVCLNMDAVRSSSSSSRGC